MVALLTKGQVERSLTQRIQALYFNRLGQCPAKVTCQFFDEKLAIFLEDVITQSEQLLLVTGREEFAESFRVQLDEAIKPDVTVIIEETVGVSVKTLLNHTDLGSGFGGMIAVLDNAPPMLDLTPVSEAARRWGSMSLA